MTRLSGVEDPRRVVNHAFHHRAEFLVRLARGTAGMGGDHTRITVRNDFVIRVIAHGGVAIAVDLAHDFLAYVRHIVVLAARARDDELVRSGAVVNPMKRQVQEL